MWNAFSVRTAEADLGEASTAAGEDIGSPRTKRSARAGAICFDVFRSSSCPRDCIESEGNEVAGDLNPGIAAFADAGRAARTSERTNALLRSEKEGAGP